MSYNNKGNVYKVCDYLVLDLRDSDISDTDTNTYTWFIPDSAYKSNRRSQVATMEVISGGFQGGADQANVLFIEFHQGSYNSYSSSKQHPVIGFCRRQFRSGSNNFKQSYDCVGAGEVLISARPREIKLKFVPTETAAGATFAGKVCLKFSYYDAVGTGESMAGEYSHSEVI
jgi:hypothetical protein